MIGRVITSENLQLVLICLLLVVLKSKVAHCYHPFLFDKNLPWLLFWLVENVVAQWKFKHWTAYVNPDFIFPFILYKYSVF